MMKNLNVDVRGASFEMRFRPAMLRVIIPFLFVFFSGFIVASFELVLNQPSVKAEQGVLDLRNWDSEGEVISLTGEWSFFWGEYFKASELAELDVSEINQHENLQYLSLPGTWNVQRAYYPIYGHATFVLNVLLPDEATYVLEVPELNNRYRLWLNGELKFNDDLSVVSESYSGASRTRYFHFKALPEGNQIVLHVLNDRYREGGVWPSIKITRADQKNLFMSSGLTHSVMLGLLLAMLAFLLCYVAYSKNSIAYFYLACFSILIGIRSWSVNEGLLFSLFDIHSWELRRTIEFCSIYMALPFLALFMGMRYPEYFSLYFHRTIAGLMLLLFLLVLLTPAGVYSHTEPYMPLFIVFFSVSWMGAVLDSSEKYTTPIVMPLMGGLALCMAGVNDVLYINRLIDTEHFTHLGALVFIAAYLVGRQDIDSPVIVEKPKVTLIDEVEESLRSKEVKVYLESNLNPDHRELVALSMSLAMDLWENHLERSKIEFAEDSGLWRVTNDSGTLKTRTLDKYLSLKTLPKSPRYKIVVQSLEFIEEQKISDGDKNVMRQVSGILTELSS